MRKLLTLAAVLVVPGLVMAQGVITAPNVDFDISGGETTKSFDIMITGPVAIDGLNLNLQIGDGSITPDMNILYTAGPKFVNVDIIGPGTLFNPANFGQNADWLITPQVAGAGTVHSTVGQKHSVAADTSVVLAHVVIELANSKVGESYPLLLSSFNGFTDYADGSANPQIPTLVDGSITITPEPASVLLLIGALPLLRRRH